MNAYQTMPRGGGNGGNLLLMDDSGRRRTPEQILKTGIDDQTTVDKVLKLNLYGRKEYKPLFKRHDLCHRFRNDQQWSDEEEKKFTDAGRIPLKFNILRTHAWHLLGLQRMSRSDIKVEGVDQGVDEELADIAYKMIRHNEYINNLDETNSYVFSDGLDEMGNWHTFFDPFKGVNGRVVVERVEPGGVVYDPNTLDIGLTDCKWVARTVYMTPQDIKKRWKNIDLKFTDYEWERWWEGLQKTAQSLIVSPYATLIDRVNNLYAVIEIYERESKRYYRVVDRNGTELGEYVLPLEMSRFYMDMNPGHYVVPGEKTVMRKTCIMPYMHTNLGTVEQDYEYYPYTPFMSGYSGYRLQRNSSFMYSGLDPQREVNIRRSNQIEYIQRDLRGGGFVPHNTELTKKLNADGANVTKWYDIDSVGEVPIKNTAALPAVGLKDLEETAVRYLEMTMGFSAQAHGGIEVAQESGIHRRLRREESQTTIYPMLEMFNKQRSLVAKAVLERMIKNMTTNTMIRVVGEGDAKPESLQITAQMKQRLKAISEWDIRTAEGPYQTEMKREEFVRKLEIFKMIHETSPGPVIMPSDYLKDSGLQNIDDLGARLDARYLQIIGGGGSQPGQPGGQTQ